MTDLILNVHVAELSTRLTSDDAAPRHAAVDALTPTTQDQSEGT